MSQAEFDKLMDHEYDGIHEYDNPLPSWWSGVFIATIVFSAVYWLYFHWGGPGKSELQVHAEELTEFEKLRVAELAKLGAVDEKSLTQLTANAAAMENGKKIFATHCVVCHLEGGRGHIGPNLTDEYQINGSTRVDIYHTIYNGGRKGKGMQPWNKQLKPDELMSVAAFVSALRGTNLPGKAPEGAKVGPLR